ncbi:hypothetical protein DIJ64_14060 [Mycobacterium leprae]|uniref:SHSP domain-containing protein n=1 Tax=Mycobacterium leprae TaxID=1769 RepID=A0AAD0KYD9_MYCLR|nr:Hsp20 family protein [Mycobacterium leprae]AWV48776.1 hypothetical protein DIJ64_14060 [Mycobacterium leprae]OAR21071.1 hypothetical protein A8144_07915 [Mycobacterium leprae 3125609]OAX71218.1 hypothetical protein A3216_06985 [Mycobacterium leprae 7935681]
MSLGIHDEHRDEHGGDRSADRMLHEVRYSSFHRAFQLTVHVTSEVIEPSYDAGILTVRVTDAFKVS